MKTRATMTVIPTPAGVRKKRLILFQVFISAPFCPLFCSHSNVQPLPIIIAKNSKKVKLCKKEGSRRVFAAPLLPKMLILDQKEKPGRPSNTRGDCCGRWALGAGTPGFSACRFVRAGAIGKLAGSFQAEVEVPPARLLSLYRVRNKKQD
jgi:hypothetical protein